MAAPNAGASGPVEDPKAEASPDSGASPARHRGWRWAAVAAWLLVAVGAVAIGVSLWVRRTFGAITIDQLLSNLPGGGGEGAGGSELVVSGVVTGLVIPVAIVGVLALLVRRSLASLREHGVLHGARVVWLRVVAGVLAVLVALAGGGLLGATVGLKDYVAALAQEARTGEGIANYYVAPEVPAGPPGGAGGQPQNLILIYLESIEDAFADDTLFEKNMLEPLQEATAGWDTIPELTQYDGGGWTMSGIVSTQCGIPLRSASALGTPTELNELGIGSPVSSYLPGATCLGDVLAGAGYTNVFMGGADARFAGKGAFLRTHGTSEVKDLPYWQRLGETEVRDDWGLSDRRLFERARDTVTELAAAEEPFALTLLTLDTHEGPRVFEYCDWDTETAMTAITYCSMQQVAGFVDFLEDEGVLEDTVVMVMGDHQKMLAEGASFWDELNGATGRTIFNRVWSPEGVEIAATGIDQFSVYPTILELLGFELPGHRGGIGVSAVADPVAVPPGSVLELDSDEYRAIVRSRSVDFYAELWQTP